MKLEYFLYLKAISEAKSITLASNRLFISQQALSKAIQSFEKELGVPLFLRTNKGTILTKEGEEVLSIGNQILDLVSQVSQLFPLEKKNNLHGSLELMTSTYILDQFLCKTISNFLEMYPNIKINIQFGDAIDVLHSFSSTAIDIGFIYTVTLNGVPHPIIKAPLKFFPIAKYRYVALVSGDSSLAKLESVSLQQLANYTIIFSSSKDVSNLNNYKLLKSFGMTKFYTANSYSLHGQLIANNVGISITAHTPNIDENNTFLENVKLIPISNNIYNTLGYVINEKNLNDSFINLFLQEFLNH